MGGERLGGRWWEEDKPYRHFGVALATWGSYKAPTMLRRLMEHWQQFQIMAPQLMPPEGAILLTVTSQDQQNTLQKSRLVNIG